MANKKISELNALLGASLDVSADLVCVVDDNAVETKHMVVDEFIAGIEDSFTTLTTTGLITAGNGLTVSAGNLAVSAGTITASGNITTTGGIIGVQDTTWSLAHAHIATMTGASNAIYGIYAGSLLTSGAQNTFIGQSAGKNTTTGSNNVFIGRAAGNNNTEANYNTFIGVDAGNTTTTGNNNVFIGRAAGNNNTTGAGNVFIGYATGYYETGSNKLYIDNSTTATPLIGGDFSTNELTINGKLTVTGDIIANGGAIDITGARDEPEGALANLLTALATIGLVTDSTTAS